MLLVACSGSDADDGQPTPTPPPPTATTAPPSPPAAEFIEPDGARILEHLSVLTRDIGSRTAGSDAERQASQYIADQLTSYGYEVEVQPFPVSLEAARSSSFSVRAPTSDTLPSIPLAMSVPGTISARLIHAGLGNPADFDAQARGAIALIERGTLTFEEKVRNAAAAGAVAAVIYNNEPGTFYGTLANESAIPALAISQRDGQNLAGLAGAQAVVVEVSVGAGGTAESQNVIARPPGQECHTVTGGHYDSVQAGPGANDNGSGTASVLQIAEVMARNGKMGNHCFVLFGAEEVGLVGSRAFVASLSDAERDAIEAMVNLDMVGVGDIEWRLIGSSELQELAEPFATALGMAPQLTRATPTGSSSVHASFIEAGIPALMLYRSNDDAWHQPEDRYERVNPEYVELAARLAIAVLDELSRR